MARKSFIKSVVAPGCRAPRRLARGGLKRPTIQRTAVGLFPKKRPDTADRPLSDNGAARLVTTGQEGRAVARPSVIVLLVRRFAAAYGRNRDSKVSERCHVTFLNRTESVEVVQAPTPSPHSRLSQKQDVVARACSRNPTWSRKVAPCSTSQISPGEFHEQISPGQRHPLSQGGGRDRRRRARDPEGG